MRGEEVDLADTKSVVAVARADDYQGRALTAALERAFALLGGLERFVRPGERVFVKINHLPPPSPPGAGHHHPPLVRPGGGGAAS